MFTRRGFSEFCCNSVLSLWWELPLGWKLILNPAQRGRLRVTSAPFNAARVRDREKWIHHHHLCCWYENNEFLFSACENICTLHLNTFKMTKDKSIKIWIHGQRSLFEAHVEKSRHAGRDGGQVGAADDCSSEVRLAAVGWRWKQSPRQASKLSISWPQQSSQGQNILGCRS